MDKFKTWFNKRYPDDSLSTESLEFIEKDLKLRSAGDKYNTHWCYTYLNGNRQFVFRIVEEYIRYMET